MLSCMIFESVLEIHHLLCISEISAIVYGNAKLVPECLPFQQMTSNVGTFNLESLAPEVLGADGGVSQVVVSIEA